MRCEAFGVPCAPPRESYMPSFSRSLYECEWSGPSRVCLVTLFSPRHNGIAILSSKCLEQGNQYRLHRPRLLRGSGIKRLLFYVYNAFPPKSSALAMLYVFTYFVTRQVNGQRTTFERRGIKSARKIRCAFREGADVVETQLGLIAQKK